MHVPLVSIIIPTHNRKLMVIRLIRSILHGSFKNVEIIVIDDMSTDGTYTELKKRYRNRKNIIILRNTEHLFTAGSRNKGMKKAKGKYLFFIDDDNVLESHAVQEMVRVFEQDASVGELGPVNYSFSRKNQLLWVGTKRDMSTTKTEQPRSLATYGEAKLWDTVDVPNAFMVRASVVKDFVITFDPVFEIMYEESDFAYKIRNAGFGVKVLRTAHIYHDIENGGQGRQKLDYMHHFMTSTRRTYVFGRNRILFHSRYSSKRDMIGIVGVWVWVFFLYYAYKIFSYSGSGNFSLMHKIRLVWQYLRGTLKGIHQLSMRRIV